MTHTRADEQRLQARLIAALKRLDVPAATAAVLADDPEAIARLARAAEVGQVAVKAAVAAMTEKSVPLAGEYDSAGRRRGLSDPRARKASADDEPVYEDHHGLGGLQRRRVPPGRRGLR